MSKSTNPLRDLHRFGVSVWYDYISRSLITSGELARLIKEDGVRGVTSNPAIFEKAIGGSSDYDSAIRRLAKPKQTPQELFELLAVEDIREACDILAPLYAESKGGDGFVSLELPPHMARDARGSGVEAVRLNALVARPNLMVKIPGTVEGLAAFGYGVDREAVLAKLETEGLDAFSRSFETLMGKLAGKRALLEA